MPLSLLRKHSLKTRISLLTLGIVLSSLWALALYARATLQTDMQRLVAQQQRSTASLVAAQMEHELQRRVSMLRQLAAHLPARALRDASTAQTYLETQPGLHELFNSGVTLHDLQGVVQADTLPDAGRIGRSYRGLPGMAQALEYGRPSVGSPSMERQTGVSLLPIMVPVLDNSGRVAGALAGLNQIGAPSFLDTISEHPYGQSGQLLLLDRALRLVITASDPSRVMQALPEPGVNAAIDRFLAGAEGVATFTSPRGLEVQSAAQPIGAADWLVSVSLPTEEAYAPFRRLQARFLAATVLISVLAWLLARWLLARELAPALQAVQDLTRQAQQGEPSHALPVSRKDEIGRLITAFNRLLQAQARRKAMLREVLNASNVGIFTTDTAQRITLANDTMGALFGCEAKALLGREYLALVAPGDRDTVQHRLHKLDGGCGKAIETRHRFMRQDGGVFWGLVSVRPFDDPDIGFQGAVGVLSDITEQVRARALERFHRHTLELLATGAALPDVLQAIVAGMERLRDPVHCCLLQVLEDGQHLGHAITAGLPDFFASALEGLPIGPHSSACARAALQVCRVVVPDLATLPEDDPLRALAERAQLRACWSQPIVGTDGQVLGTLALYLPTAQAPSREDEELLEQAARLASLAISQHRSRAAVAASEERYRAITEWTPTPIAVHRMGTLLYVNPALARLLGEDAPQALVGRNALDWVHPDSRALVLSRVQQVGMTGAEAPPLLERYVRRDGSVVEVEAQAKRIVYGGANANLVCLHDVTERNRALQRLQLAAQVFDHAREGIMVTTPDGTILEVNEAFQRITGYSRAEVLGQNPRILSSGRQGSDYYRSMWRTLRDTDHWVGEVWNRRKSGELYAEMQTISTVRDAQGRAVNYVSLFSDVTVAKEHAQRMERIAHYDSLTNLPNRVLLSDRLHQALIQSQRRNLQTAVAFLDLDGFKSVNDQYGHDIGDQLLVALAARMRHALREGDTLARLGGDEFVAVMVDLSDPQSSAPLLSRLLKAVAEPLTVQGYPLQVSASLGVTFYPQSEDVDADQLLRQADQAMYQAKVAGKNRYHVFDAEQDRHVRGHHEHLDQIRNALAHDEFVLHYQPKVNMHTGRVLGAEALIRWQHPERGLVGPGDFLPVVENQPLAVEIGDWVLERAVRQLEQWSDAGLSLGLSVNVGARQLQHPDFVSKLQALLGRHPRVDPARLELEVLETSALEDMEHICGVIRACSDMGIAFALDDFGTGYSSLAYLKQLPASVLKIDQSFVRDMLDDPDDLAILDGVIGMASAFRREVIAEGVESIAHGTLLLQLGCSQGQGYGIARPMPANDLERWLEEWEPAPAWRSAHRVHREDFALLYGAIEHRIWCREVENVIEERRMPLSEAELRECRFGRWLNHEGARRYSSHPAYLLMDTLHERLHAHALELHRLALAGQHDAARAGLAQLYHLQEAVATQIEKLLLAPA
ncbi:MAG: EAL domain-containing protein [Rhodoferax sp.]